MNELTDCATCRVKRDRRACRSIDGTGAKNCPMVTVPQALNRAEVKYREEKIREFARQASIQEAECYANREAVPFVKRAVKPRLLEICEFAKKMAYKRLGLAYCSGLQQEAVLMDQALKSHGFEVASVSCKAGCFPKETIGIKDEEKVNIGKPESMCNPIGQAEALNDQGAEFNILMGICVGHDSLFFQHSIAPTTVFAVKDRVFGHNPMAAIYTILNYSGWLLENDQ